MIRPSYRAAVLGPLVAFALAGCSAATRQSGAGAVQPAQSGEAAAARQVPAANRADVDFLDGMIHHHAQAVLMAGWAPSHGASPAVAELCRRIVVSQRDEIALMQTWLRDHGQTPPDADASHDMMPGMEQMLMPGMLTAAQLVELDSARGPAFDRKFLGFMIMHHRGALSMVQQLFDANGAAQDDDIFALASNISADQQVEIDRMTRMLAAMASTSSGQ